MFKEEINRIFVSGMHCKHCANSISDALLKVNGVKKVKVNLSKQEVKIISKEKLDAELLKEVITDLGYEIIED